MASQRRIELGSGPIADDMPGFGVPVLDDRLSHLFWGDNVVWRVGASVSDSGFRAALTTAAGRVPAYRDMRVIHPLHDEEAELDDLSDSTFIVVDLRGFNGEFDALRLMTHVFERRMVCFWLIDASSEPDWLSYAQCVITADGSHLRIDRADGRPLDLLGVLLPYEIAHDEGTHALELVVRRAPAGALLGRGLRRLRRERGWSQTELGSLIGVSGSAISQAERGLLSLSLESVLELTARLGVPIDVLLRGPVDNYALSRHPIGGTDAAVHPWDAQGTPGSTLRTLTLSVPLRATASAGYADVSTQILFVARGLVQALLPNATPLLRAGDRLTASGADLRGVRNVGTGDALVFWIAVSR